MRRELPDCSTNDVHDEIRIVDVFGIFVKSKQDLEGKDAVGEELQG